MLRRLAEMITKVHERFFIRKRFLLVHKFLYRLSLRGMGVLNYSTPSISGEDCFLKGFLHEGRQQVVLDVGANQGHYAKRVRELSKTASIYCFEPHPKTFSALSKEADASALKAFNVGCGDAQGKLAIYDYQDADGSEHASLYKDVMVDLHGAGNVASVEVDIITLDDFCAQHGVRHINLLKIDTEGHELKVLQGAKSLLDSGSIDAIHFEFNEMNVISRVWFKDFKDALPNYTFYRLLPDGFMPLDDYSPLYCEIFAYQNIVALKG